MISKKQRKASRFYNEHVKPWKDGAAKYQMRRIGHTSPRQFAFKRPEVRPDVQAIERIERIAETPKPHKGFLGRVLGRFGKRG